MTEQEYSDRELDLAIAEAIGAGVVDCAHYTNDRYAAHDAIHHYRALYGYRLDIVADDNSVMVSLMRKQAPPHVLLRTVATGKADRFETAVVACILRDVERRLTDEVKRLESQAAALETV